MILSRIDGYAVHDELGRGAHGRVLRATAHGGALVAIKVFDSLGDGSAEEQRRWADEVRAAGRVSSANLVRTLESGIWDHGGGRVPYIVMEYLSGRTLRRVLDESPEEARSRWTQIGGGVAAGLGALHEADVVHRDVKPDNIMLCDDGRVVLMDLGVAACTSEAWLSSAESTGGGTARYAAPEQLRGEHSVDGRADLFSLGVVLYELIAGTHPHGETTTLGSLVAGVDEGLPRISTCREGTPEWAASIIHALLAGEPSRRPASADLVRDVLERGPDSIWWRTRQSDVRNGTPMAGRVAELTRLLALCDRVSSKGLRSVVVVGSGGMGKSKLVEAFAEACTRRPWPPLVLVGAHTAGRTGGRLDGLAQAVRDGYRRGIISTPVAELLTASTDLAEPLQAFLDGRAWTDGDVPFGSGQLEAALLDLIEGLCRRLPVVLVLEDLHHAPPGAVGHLASLVAQWRDERLVLVATTRPGEIDAADREALLDLSTQFVELGPLDRDGLYELLVAEVGSPTSAEALSEQVGRVSGGCPLVALESVRELRSSGALVRKADGSWALRPGVEPGLPDSLERLVTARVGRLPLMAREILELAACCGDVVETDLVARADGRPLSQVAETLAELSQVSRFLRSAATGYRFVHDYVREIVRASIGVPLHRGYCAALAGALLERADVDPGESVAVRARACELLVEAGDGGAARDLLRSALVHFRQSVQPGRCAALLVRALAEPDLLRGTNRVDCILECNETVRQASPGTDWKALLTECVEVARAADDAARGSRAWNELGVIAGHAGRLREALECHVECVALARRASTRHLVVGLLGLTHFQMHTGDHDGARRSLDEIEARTGVESDMVVRAGTYRAELLHLGGEEAEGIAAMEHLYEEARSHGGTNTRMHVTKFLASLCYRSGRAARSREIYEELRALAVRTGTRSMEMDALCCLGVNAGEDHRFSDAAEFFERGQVLARALGAQHHEFGARVAFAHMARARGRLDEADRRLTAVENDLSVEDPLRLGQFSITRSSTYLRLGHHELARQAAESGLTVARASKRAGMEVPLLVHLANAVSGTGDLDRAESMLREALDLQQEHGLDREVWRPLLFLGRLRLERGDHTEARRLLRRAADLAAGRSRAMVSTLASLARVDPDRVDDAIRAFDRVSGDGREMDVFERLEAAADLWTASGDDRFLLLAREDFRTLWTYAPADCRDGLADRLPVCRLIFDDRSCDALGDFVAPSEDADRV